MTWDAHYPMAPQTFAWTCSVASWDWVVNATNTADMDREHAGQIIGYPECVDEVYGLKDAQCLVRAYDFVGLAARQAWVTFDQAFAIARVTTGQINPIGMYHFMALRGVQGSSIWLANSAPGYHGVGDTLSRAQFDALGPVQLVYLAQPQPAAEAT